MNKEKLFFQYRYFMQKTLQLAKKGQGKVSPNPLVGALLVKGDKIIASGYHKRAGGDHAEIVALKKARQLAKGATLYVNLEPCCHWGKTPPCVDAIIKAGIKKVIIAVKDPNPCVAGKSITKLKQAGIEVVLGILEKEAIMLNEIFFINMLKKRPFIAGKIASSLDGKIATFTGDSKWITCQQARVFSRKLRDKYDAVLIGVNTALLDNPTLNGIQKIPYKVIIDPQLKINPELNLIKNNQGEVIVVGIDKKSNIQRKIKLEKLGIKIIFLKKTESISVVRETIKKLWQIEISSVFVEGGSQTLGYFFDSKLIDKFYFFIAPKIIGGKNAPCSVGGKGIDKIKYSIKCEGGIWRKIGEDMLFVGYPRYKNGSKRGGLFYERIFSIT